MKPIKSLTVHIGTEKTGTTTLQELLFTNRQTLRESGIGVLTSPGERNNRQVVTYCVAPDRIDDHLLTLGLTDPQRRSAWRAQVRADLETELQELSGHVDNVILTSEHFHSRLNYEAELRTLSELLSPFFEQIRILVYLRRQDRVATSSYGTYLAFGGMRPLILPPKATKDSTYYNYLEMIDRWVAVFGRENVIIRPFDPQRWIERDLIRDFLHHIGVGEPLPELVIPPKRNESISAKAQPILLRFNRHFPSFINSRPNPHARELRLTLVQHLREKLPGAPRLPSRAEAERFLSLFEESNRTLWQRYCDDVPLFDVDFSDYPESSDMEEPEPQSLDLLARAVAMYLSRIT